MSKEKKTNAMRILEQKKVTYTPHFYEDTGAVAGVDVANALGEPVEQVYKTLVTVGKTGEHYVFVIPVADELDLKKAAKAAGEKNIAMIKSKELLPLTGYIHGGCSPVGMKKAFPTFFDETILGLEKIFFSGGRVGFQVEVAVADIEKVVRYQTADLTVD